MCISRSASVNKPKFLVGPVSLGRDTRCPHITRLACPPITRLALSPHNTPGLDLVEEVGAAHKVPPVTRALWRGLVTTPPYQSPAGLPPEILDLPHS